MVRDNFFLISTFQILPLLYQYWVRLDLFLLEGSLELELNRSKVGLIKKIIYCFPLVILAFLAYLLQYYGGYSLGTA
jgi:hypothetical protein